MRIIKFLNKLFPKKYQNNRGAVDFDGTDDRIERGSAILSGPPMTFYARFKLNSVSTSRFLTISNTSSDRNYISLLSVDGSGWRFELRDNNGSAFQSSGWFGAQGGTVDTDEHTLIGVSRSSTDHEVYLDGVSLATDNTSVNSITGGDTTSVGRLFRQSGSSSEADAIIRETAIWNTDLTDDEIEQIHRGLKGTVLGIQKTNLQFYTPLDDVGQGISGDGIVFRDLSGNSNNITGNDGSNNTGLTGQAESVQPYSQEVITVTGKLAGVSEEESIEITDAITTTIEGGTASQGEGIEISDSIVVVTVDQPTQDATRIISINPLIYVTNTSPAKIVKVDISTPSVPTWDVFELSGTTNAKFVAYNSKTDQLYVATANGLVKKVDFTDPNTQSTIDVSDTDNLLISQTLSDFGVTYVSTENTTGEMYVIDERSTIKLDSDFQVIAPQQTTFDSDFNLISTFKIDSDFQLLSEQTLKMDSSFVLRSSPVNDIIPIKQTDCKVLVDSVELDGTDVLLDSVQVEHREGEKSIATFRLTRKHDNLDTDLQGNTRPITNQNNVSVVINGNTVFSGQVAEINPVYDETNDTVEVIAKANEPASKFNNITLSLGSLNDRITLYDVLVNQPRIINPVINEDEENPQKFKGIKVDLGTEITQRLSRFTIFDSLGSIAEDIQNGDFDPRQNWTYFWSPTVTKFGGTTEDIGNLNLGETRSVTFTYIGTSLSPVTEGLWNLDNAKHRRQRIYDDKEEELGEYTVGSAPFKEISVRNGKLNAKYRWEDRDDGLYSVKDAGFDFESFAKQVADLEFEKLKNINGQIFPETSCDLDLTMDAYFFFDINLLTRINIDNTTQSGIYKNSNGFPVSVKGILIDCGTMKVTLNCDNQKSNQELEDIDGQFPDETDDEFNEFEDVIFITPKTDMRTRLEVQ